MHRFTVNHHNKTIKMEKTAIQQLIGKAEKQRGLSSGVAFHTRKELYSWLISLLQSIKSDERAQIEQAYAAGRMDMANNDGVSPQDYFTSKYGNDE